MRPRLGEVWAQARSMGMAVLVALSIRCFVFELFQIPSGSMIPTLAVGDRVVVNKLAYGPRIPFTSTRLWRRARPSRGEVVVFISPKSPHVDYIKRVIGLAGDTVEVREGQVLVNGEPLAREAGRTRVFRDRSEAGLWGDVVAREDCERSDSATYPVLADPTFFAGARDMPPRRVPPDNVFVMGDNRDHSEDSRSWGCVPEGALLGRATRFFYLWGERGLGWRRLGWRVHQTAAKCADSLAPSAYGED